MVGAPNAEHRCSSEAHERDVVWRNVRSCVHHAGSELRRVFRPYVCGRGSTVLIFVLDRTMTRREFIHLTRFNRKENEKSETTGPH